MGISTSSSEITIMSNQTGNSDTSQLPSCLSKDGPLSGRYCICASLKLVVEYSAVVEDNDDEAVVIVVESNWIRSPEDSSSIGTQPTVVGCRPASSTVVNYKDHSNWPLYSRNNNLFNGRTCRGATMPPMMDLLCWTTSKIKATSFNMLNYDNLPLSQSMSLCATDYAPAWVFKLIRH